jgi:hypothetical protein
MSEQSCRYCHRAPTTESPRKEHPDFLAALADAKAERDTIASLRASLARAEAERDDMRTDRNIWQARAKAADAERDARSATVSDEGEWCMECSGRGGFGKGQRCQTCKGTGRAKGGDDA